MTGEVAYADATEVGGVTRAYYTNDAIRVAGYTYLDQNGDADTYVSFGSEASTAFSFANTGWKTIDHATIAVDANGNGITTLRLYYLPNINTITFVADSGHGDMHSLPADIKLYSDQSFVDPTAASKTAFTLPTSVTRDGYTLMGWSTERSADGFDVVTSQGKNSQTAAAAADDKLDQRTSDAGTVYTDVHTYDFATKVANGVGGTYTSQTPLYTMPTTIASGNVDSRTVTLYAVWRQR